MSGRELSWLCVEQTVQHNHTSTAIISFGTVIAITAAKDLCCQGPRLPMTIVIMDLWIQRQGQSSTGKGCLLKVIEMHRIETDPLRHSRGCMRLTLTHTQCAHYTHIKKKIKKKKRYVYCHLLEICYHNLADLYRGAESGNLLIGGPDQPASRIVKVITMTLPFSEEESQKCQIAQQPHHHANGAEC